MICMDERLLEQIDQRIEASRSALTQSIKKLIAIKSVKGEPLPGAPFGAGPRAVLDAVMEMGKAEDFYTTDYHVGVVSLAVEDGQPDLGIWLHGDVMPEGTGWLWPPFDATEYQGCIIGRDRQQRAVVRHFSLAENFQRAWDPAAIQSCPLRGQR